MLWLLGDWREVRAMIATQERAVEFEDVAMALVRFENGAMSSIVNSVLSPRQESYLRLDFQQATVEVNALYRYDNEHWRFSLPEGTGSSTATSEVSALEHWRALAGSPNVTSGHEVQLAEILDSMERGEPPPVTGDDARRILEFIASLYKAAMTGQPVLRGEITPADPYYYASNGAPQTLETS